MTGDVCGLNGGNSVDGIAAAHGVADTEWVEVGPLKQTYHIKLNVQDLDKFGDEFEEVYGGLSIVMIHAAYESQGGDLYGTYSANDAEEAGELEFARYLDVEKEDAKIRWQCVPGPMEVDA